MEGKKKNKWWALSFAVLIDILFIVYYAWSEYKSGIFHWWHVIVLSVVLILLIVNYLTKWLNTLTSFVKKNIGFDREIKSVDGMREYFLENTPILFFVSAYSMEFGFKGSYINPVTMVGSIIMLLISFCFAIGGILGKLMKESWLQWTYQHTEWLGILAMAAFIFELIAITKNLPTFWGYIYLIIGLIYVIFIGLHYILNISSSPDKLTGKRVDTETQQETVAKAERE